jgi:hypothetical protein
MMARLRPATFRGEELFRSFPTEDGYMMLTIARNLSLGLGMTHAAGSIATNGVQPLQAFLQAGAFSLAGSDREAGLRLVFVLSAVLAGLTAFALSRLGRLLLGESDEGKRASALAASVWLASPVVLFQSMNMLETGLYTLFVVLSVLVFGRGHCEGPGSQWSGRQCTAMGALLGVAFWARNDAVFLMVAVGFAHWAATTSNAAFSRRARETAVMGVAALALASPWVAYNYVGFGSLVPVSGLAHLRPTDVGQNLAAAAAALFEMLTLVATFEHSPAQHRAGFLLISAAVSAAAIVSLSILLWRGRARRAELVPWLVPALMSIGLLSFYVLAFDAPYFLRRYLFPLSPFLALVWARLAVRLWHRVSSTALGRAAPLLPVVLFVNFASRDGLFLPRGSWREHQFRGVDWIRAHLDEEAWVGAFQSGTVGFFHDRTINLDGKLNPRALLATRAGRHEAYVLESPVQFVIDWATIAEPWYQGSPKLRQGFEWVELDRGRNFAVLRRRSNTGRNPSPR